MPYACLVLGMGPHSECEAARIDRGRLERARPASGTRVAGYETVKLPGAAHRHGLDWEVRKHDILREYSNQSGLPCLTDQGAAIGCTFGCNCPRHMACHAKHIFIASEELQVTSKETDAFLVDIGICGASYLPVILCAAMAVGLLTSVVLLTAAFSPPPRSMFTYPGAAATMVQGPIDCRSRGAQPLVATDQDPPHSDRGVRGEEVGSSAVSEDMSASTSGKDMSTSASGSTAVNHMPAGGSPDDLEAGVEKAPGSAFV